MGMPHVSGESQHVAGNLVTRIGACRQRFDSESMAQVVEVRLWATFRIFDAGCFKNRPKRLSGNSATKLVTSSMRHKDVLVIAGHFTSQGEILAERSCDAFMHADQSTLAELGFTNL